MHIYEGILSATSAGQGVLVGGIVAAAAGTAIGLYRMDPDRIPKTALLSSAFFIASLVQVPLGQTSVHLTLGGLMGLVLGWATFPAVLVGLILQAAFCSPAGLTTLGVNTLVMALPGVVCHYLLRHMARSRRSSTVALAGFAAGALAVVLGGALSAGVLFAAGRGIENLAPVFFAAHLPVALVEGLVTANVVLLLRKVRPEVLDSLPLPGAVSVRVPVAAGEVADA